MVQGSISHFIFGNFKSQAQTYQNLYKQIQNFLANICLRLCVLNKCEAQNNCKPVSCILWKDGKTN